MTPITTIGYPSNAEKMIAWFYSGRKQGDCLIRLTILTDNTGKNDEAKKVQLLIDNAEGVFYFPSGEYVMGETLTISKSIHLVGQR